MRTALTFATGITLFAAVAAQAGGYAAPVVETAPVVAVTPAPVSDWAGAYGGASIGYSGLSDDVVGLDYYLSGRRISHGTDLGATDIKGPTFGLNLGYRWQRQNWVFGPELWIEGGNVKADDDIVYKGEANGVQIDVEGNLESKLKSLVGLQFKTGYLVNPETLVYGTAGVVRGKFELTATNPRGSLTESYSSSGYTLGLGAERKIRDNLSVYGEWQYRDFGRTDVLFDLGQGEVLDTIATPVHHNIKMGLNFKF